MQDSLEQSPEIRDYLDETVSRLRNSIGENLSAVYLGGSFCLSDFDAHSSDIDVVAFVKESLTIECKKEIVSLLSHASFPCNAHGLDFGIYETPRVNPLSQPLLFELGFATGRDWNDEIEYGGEYSGGVIDLAILRQAGIALYGPPPQDVIGAVDQEWLRRELRQTVRWHLKYVHDPFHDPYGINAVLNACRACAFFEEGRFLSKGQGGAWACSHFGTPYRDLVDEAIRSRKASTSWKLEKERVQMFLSEVEGRYML